MNFAFSAFPFCFLGGGYERPVLNAEGSFGVPSSILDSPRVPQKFFLVLVVQSLTRVFLPFLLPTFWYECVLSVECWSLLDSPSSVLVWL